MTSKRAIHANRSNSKKSTGPRTYSGKEQSKKNSLKHGFSLAQRDPHYDGEIECLAMLIAGQFNSVFAAMEAARVVAEAQIFLKRIQAFRVRLLQSCEIEFVSGRQTNLEISPNKSFSKFLVQLERLDRYESRALSRRKSAILKFLSLVS